jgi:hypothetical protein
LEIKRQFNAIVEARRKKEASGDGEETADLLQTFMTSSYKAPINGGRLRCPLPALRLDDRSLAA